MPSAYRMVVADMTAVECHQPSWLSTVAHELRGPLTALETASELLDRDLDSLDPSQIRAMVSGIHRRALWMRGLMENLFVSAAVTEGRLSVHTRPTDMLELVEEVKGLVEPLLERKRQVLRIVASTSALAEADAHRISQVLLNLISNAHKYSAAGTEVDVQVSADAEMVRVSVSDRGPGVPDRAMQAVFRAYDRAGRTDGDGLGIGLWIVQSIVGAHDGRVGVFNRTHGGSTFWFELRRVVVHTILESTVPLEIAAGMSAASMSVEGVVVGS